MEDNNDHNHHHDHQITNKNSNINSNGGSGGGGGTPSASSNSRWTPTKEQVNMLEGLYRQGIRTPSAEQIQQITSRLRAFGHIEGKNVFYWFQNHKARQRQKQKQDSVAAYINLNRFLNDKPSTTAHHHHQFPCPNANVVCGQYYVPIQTQIADPVGTIYQQQQIYHQNNIPIKTSTTTTTTPSPSRLPRLEIFQDKSRIFSAAATSRYNHVPQAGHRVGSGGSEMVNDKVLMISKNGTDYRETLALFPLSPTGVLQEKSYCDDHRNISENNVPIRCYNDQLSSTPNYSGFEEGCSPDGGGDRTFYDFFSR